MSIKLKAKDELRIVPVRFERAKDGDPDIVYPDIDDRGHNFKVPAVNGLAESVEIRGPVMGLTKKQEVKVNMIRECIDTSAKLYLTSSDDDAVSVTYPKKGKKISSSKKCTVKLKGGNFTGNTPKSARIEVRFGAADGPIIYELTVYVFNPLIVNIQPHVVTIHNSTGAGGSAPKMKVSKVMEQVKALWACCGIQFNVQKTKSFAVNLATANKLTWGEVNSVNDTTANPDSFVADTINVYIVQEIDGALGYGFSKAAHAGFGITHPGVFLGMKSGNDDRTSDTYWCSNDLAHELGHFFSLWHPTDGNTHWTNWRRNETWSMRFLMHNHNQTFRQNPPQGGANWPKFNDFGYGTSGQSAYRAGLISMKNVRSGAGAGRDAQCSTVRNYVAQGGAVLY